MKITKRQLRQIIREAVQLRESIPGMEAERGSKFGNPPHPLFADSYPGNGYQLGVFQDPALVSWLDANVEKSEHFKALKGLLDRTIDLPYVPFAFADDTIAEMEKHGAPAEAISNVEMQSATSDSEYNPPMW